MSDKKSCRGAPSSNVCAVPFGSDVTKPFESIVLKYSSYVDTIDMRQVAPTLAEVLGVEVQEAQLPAVDVRRDGLFSRTD